MLKTKLDYIYRKQIKYMVQSKTEVILLYKNEMEEIIWKK